MWLKVRNLTLNVAQIAYFEITGNENSSTLLAYLEKDPVVIMQGTRDECIKLRDLILEKQDVRQVV